MNNIAKNNNQTMRIQLLESIDEDYPARLNGEDRRRRADLGERLIRNGCDAVLNDRENFVEISLEIFVMTYLIFS